MKIAWRDAPGEKSDEISLVLDPRTLFYGFTTRKAVEVDAGVPASQPADSEVDVMLKKIGKQLDSLATTTFLFSKACKSTPSGAIWATAREIIGKLANVPMAVTPRKKAAAAIVAADMKHFADLDWLDDTIPRPRVWLN